jgi:hypothetical protein
VPAARPQPAPGAPLRESAGAYRVVATGVPGESDRETITRCAKRASVLPKASSSSPREDLGLVIVVRNHDEGRDYAVGSQHRIEHGDGLAVEIRGVESGDTQEHRNRAGNEPPVPMIDRL